MKFDSPYIVPFDGHYSIADASTKPLEKASDKKDLEDELAQCVAGISELQRKQRGVDCVDIEGQKKLDRHTTVALSQAAFDQATALLDEGKGYEDKYGSSQGITRVEFILALLRISIDRHVRTKETSDVSEALDRVVRRTMHLLRTHFRGAPPHLTLARRHAAASVMPQPAPQPPS